MLSMFKKSKEENFQLPSTYNPVPYPIIGTAETEEGLQKLREEGFSVYMVKGKKKKPIGQSAMGKKLSEETIKIMLGEHKLWLSGNRDFSRADFSFVDFEGFDFRNQIVAGAIFTDANFRGCYLHKTNFGGCLMDNAKFNHSAITSCDFTGASMCHCNFFKAAVVRTRFNKTQLCKTHWSKCVFFKPDFVNSNLTEANFCDTTLICTDLTQQILKLFSCETNKNTIFGITKKVRPEILMCDKEKRYEL